MYRNSNLGEKNNENISIWTLKIIDQTEKRRKIAYSTSTKWAFFQLLKALNLSILSGRKLHICETSCSQFHSLPSSRDIRGIFHWLVPLIVAPVHVGGKNRGMREALSKVDPTSASWEQLLCNKKNSEKYLLQDMFSSCDAAKLPNNLHKNLHSCNSALKSFSDYCCKTNKKVNKFPIIANCSGVKLLRFAEHSTYAVTGT